MSRNKTPEASMIPFPAGYDERTGTYTLLAVEAKGARKSRPVRKGRKKIGHSGRRKL